MADITWFRHIRAIEPLHFKVVSKGVQPVSVVCHQNHPRPSWLPHQLLPQIAQE